MGACGSHWEGGTGLILHSLHGSLVNFLLQSLAQLVQVFLTDSNFFSRPKRVYFSGPCYIYGMYNYSWLDLNMTRAIIMIILATGFYFWICVWKFMHNVLYMTSPLFVNNLN